MEKITFTCETITPMFLAGADGITPELRAPSIKGALRFWWRAVNGHLSLKELKEREAEIFGGTGNRSKVVISVQHEAINFSVEKFKQFFETYKGHSNQQVRRESFRTNAMYYMGYGVANYVKEKRKTEFVRPYIPAGFKFTIICRLKSSVVNDFLQAFKLLEKHGGLGSKSRNGYGNFKIIDATHIGKKIESIRIDLDSLFSGKLKSFSTFSEKSSLFETKNSSYSSWELAFKNVAIAYQYAREKIEKWHNWDKRELIAFPIIVKGEREMEDNNLERHSKPYFMHISQTTDGYKGEILFLPYEYLKGAPDQSEQQIKDIRNTYFKVLDDFNELLSKKLVPLRISKLSK